MALTRPKFRQVDSSTISVTDPITVLQGGSASGNVDVGFVINRASGLVNNVAIYWNETLKSFTTAYTTGAGTTDTNISVSSYAPITASKIYLTDALLWAANGNSMIAGSAITVSSTSPSNPSIGDRWYDPVADVMYEFFNDGTGTYWVDIYSPQATTAALTDTSWGGSLVPTANVTYNIGAMGAFWKDLYLGGNVQLNGTTITSSTVAGVTLTNKLTATTLSAASLLATGGTTSTSTTTGALIVTGGAGVSGNVYAGNVYTTNVYPSTIYTDNYKYANGQPFISTTLANTAEITANATGGSSVGFSLVATGVTAGNYGSATSIPTIVVDSKGRITSLTSNAVSTTINLAGTSGSGSVAGGGTLTFAGAYGVTATASSSTITVSTPQDLQTTASPAFNNGTFAGNVNIAGTLTVANLQERGSTNIVVQDPMTYFQSNVLYPWVYDTGLYSDSIGGPANTYVHHGMVRSVTNNYWGFFSNVKTEPDANINWNDAGLIWDQIKAGSLILANTTATSSATTGALQVAGGVGVAGAIYSAGLGQHAAGLQSTPIGNATPSTATFTTLTTGGLQAVAIGNVTPGTGAFTTLTSSSTIIASGNIVASSGTASTTTTTGALIVNGGAGISGAVNTGGIVSAASGFQYTAYNSGRNRIWSFGNSDGYGLAYFQGSGGFAGTTDMIGMHFGTATAAASQFSFVGNGNFYATGDVYSSYSDINLKNVVGYIVDPIALLKQIETFYYEPNEEALKMGATPGRKVGLSAQNLLKVQPETVSKRPDGYLTAQYERLVPLLVETCKAQQDQIELLQKQVADLLSKQ